MRHHWASFSFRFACRRGTRAKCTRVAVITGKFTQAPLSDIAETDAAFREGQVSLCTVAAFVVTCFIFFFSNVATSQEAPISRTTSSLHQTTSSSTVSPHPELIPDYSSLLVTRLDNHAANAWLPFRQAAALSVCLAGLMLFSQRAYGGYLVDSSEESLSEIHISYYMSKKIASSFP